MTQTASPRLIFMLTFKSAGLSSGLYLYVTFSRVIIIKNADVRLYESYQQRTPAYNLSRQLAIQ